MDAHWCERARQAFDVSVLYVLGNHAFYRGHLRKTLQAMRAAGYDRVYVLDRDEAVIGGVRFLGATMWTDFAATGNPSLAALGARQSLSDFHQIRADNYRRIRPVDLIEQAEKTRDWLRSKLAEPHDGPTVVITHHSLTAVTPPPGTRSGVTLASEKERPPTNRKAWQP